MSLDFPDELLARMWDEMDWEDAEKKLADLQERLTIAVYRKNNKDIEDLQKRIVRDTQIKCLAVRPSDSKKYRQGTKAAPSNLL